VGSGRAVEMSGWMQAGAVRSFLTQRKVRTEDALDSWAFGWYIMLSGRMFLTNERPDRIPRRPDRCKGTELTDLNFA
jgi:hypothetical protein